VTTLATKIVDCLLFGTGGGLGMENQKLVTGGIVMEIWV